MWQVKIKTIRLSIPLQFFIVIRFEETEEQKPEDAFREVITSCRSLSTYEPNNLKSALPQVNHSNNITWSNFRIFKFTILKIFQIFAAATAASFHIVIGISLAFSATLVPKLESGIGGLQLSKEQTSWIGNKYPMNAVKKPSKDLLMNYYWEILFSKASIIVLSVPVGCLISAILMEWIGRLNTIKLAAIPCVCGWALIANSSNFVEILVGRILTG